MFDEWGEEGNDSPSAAGGLEGDLESCQPCGRRALLKRRLKQKLRRFLEDTDVTTMFAGWGDDVVTTLAFADPAVAEEIAGGGDPNEAKSNRTNDNDWLVTICYLQKII